jgi:tetratricopeptide (TPR) repeat protein
MSTDAANKVLEDLRQHVLGWLFALLSLAADSLAVIQWLRDEFGKFTIVLLAIGISSLWLGLFYIYFKKQPETSKLSGDLVKRPIFPSWVRRLALSGIFAVPILAVAGVFGWKYYQSRPSDKIIVLVTDFEGPDPQNYRVTETIIEQLREAIKKYTDVQVSALSQTVTAHQGSEHARAKGKEHKASIVLWGWYSKTQEKALVNVHFEILTSLYASPLRQERETLITDVAGLESFAIQTQLSSEMSYLTLLTMGMVRDKAEDWDGAIAFYNDALNQTVVPEEMIDPATIYYYRGVAYDLKRDYDHAFADYDQAVKLKPDFVWALLKRGSIFRYHYYDYEHAIQDFSRVIQLEPDSAKWYDQRGCVYSDIRDYDHALADFNQAIKLEPNWHAAYHNRANTYSEMGDYKRALPDYDQAMKLKPNFYRTYINRASTYSEMGDYKCALADYDQAIKLEPNMAYCYLMRADFFSSIGKPESAEADYRHALVLEPNYAPAMKRVARYFALRNEHLEEALDLSKRSLQLEPENDYYWDTLAEIYYRLNRFQDAKAANDKARSYNKDGNFKFVDERAEKIEANLKERR